MNRILIKPVFLEKTGRSERMNISGDDQIIEDVLNGNVEAFGLLVKKYQRPIYNLMLRGTGSPDKAADLAQEAFIKAYEKIDLFKPGKKFFPWLYTIGLNLLRDSKRKSVRTLYLLDNEKNVRLNPRVDVEAESQFDRRAEIESLILALEKLPLGYREAIILRYREGFTMKDIAEALKVSVSGAKMRVHRGLKKLRDILAEEG